jgi:hypothetical protein
VWELHVSEIFEQTATSIPAIAWADRLRLPIQFDPALLLADLQRIEATAWTAHFVPQHYEGDWSVLPLRAPRGATHPILRITSNPGVSDWDDTEFLATSPYFRDVLARFKCPIDAARLMRLTPGSVIKDHSDHDLAAEWGYARLHIPVCTNPDVDFRLSGERVTMAPGSVWYLRLADRHSVINAGKTDRVHLVLDARMNDWLAAKLSAGVRA